MGVAEVDSDQPSLVGVAAAAPAAPSASGAAASARSDCDIEETSVSATPTPAQTCCSDGMHSIFAFLTLSEFVAASRCCRDWRAAGSSQPPFRLSQLATHTTLQAIADSRTGRHIEELIITDCTPREISLILSLSCRLPHLTRLSFTVGDDFALPPLEEAAAGWWQTDEEHTATQMPSTLRELDVSLLRQYFQVMDWSVIDSLLARVCHARTPPLTALRIRASPNFSTCFELDTQIPVRTLSRLLALKDSLTQLTLDYSVPNFKDQDWGDSLPGQWTQEHIDIFRQMTRLEELDPFNGHWSDEELIMLCAEPAPAHLRLLPLYVPPRTQAGGDALTRLPLAEANFSHSPDGGVEDLSFLRRIPTLEVISLNCFSQAQPVEMAAIVDMMAGCTRCTELKTPSPTTNAHLCRLMPSLMHLRVLDIESYRWSRIQFGGLSFASSVSHLADTLEQLSLVQQGQPMSLRELHHLHALRRLRHLDVYVTIQVLKSTSQGEIDQVRGEFDTRRPETFRRDRWPHMVQSRVRLRWD